MGGRTREIIIQGVRVGNWVVAVRGASKFEGDGCTYENTKGRQDNILGKWHGGSKNARFRFGKSVKEPGGGGRGGEKGGRLLSRKKVQLRR